MQRGWSARRALAPVMDMAQTARAGSAQDLGQRFDLGPPTDEIRALGHTLGGLLDRVAGTILTEQRLTSDLAHELRTPLSAIQGTAELVSMKDNLDDDLRRDIANILAKTHAMAVTITTLLDSARLGAAPVVEITLVSDLVHSAINESGNADKFVIGDLTQLTVNVPAGVAVRALAPVVENASRFGRTVWISARRGGPPSPSSWPTMARDWETRTRKACSQRATAGQEVVGWDWLWHVGWPAAWVGRHNGDCCVAFGRSLRGVVTGGAMRPDARGSRRHHRRRALTVGAEAAG